MAKILVPISNGFEEIEAISIIDICRRADIEVVITSIEQKEVLGAHNIKITADTLIKDENASDYDMVVLPGGLPNAFNLAEDEKLQAILKQMKEENKFLGAICAAPYALHKAQVLNENYTCYPSFEEKIRQDGYHNSDDVVIDDKVITSRGPATAINFALEIVNTLKGQEVYENIKNGILAK